MLDTRVHPRHLDIVKRLRRAGGHLRRIIEMIEDERPCMDIAQQIHAVEKALVQAKRTLIQDHIVNCLEDAADGLSRERRRSLKEFKAIAKYL
ncbi:metal-sensing transcriptional repressor [Pelagibius sp.]|uniref:metal-sensing transcriptional repressor n=1 Tax=Pelagibius sp. TaxID=1931238 RepID=UPI003BB19DC8